MAAELTVRADGFVEMAFVGETPWHRSGQALEQDASIEDWQKAAGLDWTIETTGVQYRGLSNTGYGIATYDFAGQNVLHRSDTKAPLSVVSDRYKPVQPKEVLEFFRDLIDENGFKIHTAGTLMGGKRMWALAQTGKYAEVIKGDGVGGFLLLSTSCDRSLATTARFTTVRVVCNNTLTMAHSDNAHSVSFSHIKKFDHAAVKAKLGNAVQSFGSFIEMAKVLQRQQMNRNQADVFIKNLIAPMSQVDREDYDLTHNRAYQKIMNLFDGGAMGAGMVGYTKWAMLNAVTEYYDHHKPTHSADARLNSAWFGNGDRMKNNATKILLTA
jgi:phage/plasmid-like protein (TIGR03299 family)